jgi:hypothetical protein
MIASVPSMNEEQWYHKFEAHHWPSYTFPDAKVHLPSPSTRSSFQSPTNWLPSLYV